MNNNGKIENLNEKGFGFIKIEGVDKSLFFHASQLRGVKFEELHVGTFVEFEGIETNEKGRYAVRVQIV